MWNCVFIWLFPVWSFVDLSAVGVSLTEEILFSYNFHINILHLLLGHIFTWPPSHHATTCNAINKMTNKEANTLFWPNSYNTRREAWIECIEVWIYRFTQFLCCLRFHSGADWETRTTCRNRPNKWLPTQPPSRAWMTAYCSGKILPKKRQSISGFLLLS